MMRPVRRLIDTVPWWRLEPQRRWLTVDGQSVPIPTAKDLSPPQLAADPGRLYIAYIPRGNQLRTIAVNGLQHGRYRASWYDPRTGQSVAIDDGPQGQDAWAIPVRPSPADEDWLLILDGTTKK